MFVLDLDCSHSNASMGGLETLKAYGQVFPQCYFCPTGGLNANNYQEFLAQKNMLAVGGSWMLK